jgi:hypothetical protein
MVSTRDTAQDGLAAVLVRRGAEAAVLARGALVGCPLHCVVALGVGIALVVVDFGSYIGVEAAVAGRAVVLVGGVARGGDRLATFAGVRSLDFGPAGACGICPGMRACKERQTLFMHVASSSYWWMPLTHSYQSVAQVVPRQPTTRSLVKHSRYRREHTGRTRSHLRRCRQCRTGPASFAGAPVRTRSVCAHR